MALHAFCDEGSNAAAFPLSTLFMTIENKGGSDETSPSSPEARADALLNEAWKPGIEHCYVCSSYLFKVVRFFFLQLNALA